MIRSNSRQKCCIVPDAHVAVAPRRDAVRCAIFCCESGGAVEFEGGADGDYLIEADVWRKVGASKKLRADRTDESELVVVIAYEVRLYKKATVSFLDLNE